MDSPPTNGFLMSPSDSIRDMLDIDVSAELAILFDRKRKLHKTRNELPLNGPDITQILRSDINDICVDVTPCVNPNLVTPAIRPKSPISLNSRRRKNTRTSSPLRSPEQIKSHLSFSPKHLKVGQVEKIKSTNSEINIDTSTIRNDLLIICKDNEKKAVPESKIHDPSTNVVKLAPGQGGLRLVNKLVNTKLNTKTSNVQVSPYQQHEQKQQQNHHSPQQQHNKQPIQQQQANHHLQQQQNHYTKQQQQDPVHQLQQQKQHQHQETGMEIEKDQQSLTNHNITTTNNIIISQIRIPPASSSSQQKMSNNSNATNSANNEAAIISSKNESSQKVLGRNILGQIDNNSKSNSVNIETNSNGQANEYREVNNINQSNNAESLLKPMNVNSSPKANYRQVTKLYYPKPPYTFSCLIALALKNAINGTLCVAEIFNFIMEHFPYFKRVADKWKNDVRRTLCGRSSFVKTEIPGSINGFLWKINPVEISDMDNDVQKYSKQFKKSIKKAMKFPDHLEALQNGEMKHGSIESNNENVVVNFGEDEFEEILLGRSEPYSVEEEESFEKFFNYSDSSD